MYYSAPFIEEFYKRISHVASQITDSFEIVFVNDGSPDNSLEVAVGIAGRDSRVKVIELSRNFGHHKAIMVGLENAMGNEIFLLDSDLEEAPELLTTFWNAKIKEPDVDVFYGVQNKRKGGVYERITGSIYYWFFNRITDIDYPKNTLTARIMSKQYVEEVTKFREREVDLWCVFVLAGFRQKELLVDKGSKPTTTYTFLRKINVAINTITSFSSKPLYLIFVSGLLITLVVISSSLYLFVKSILVQEEIDSWSYVIASIWMIGGFLILSIGTIGIYLSKIFSEVKERPYATVKNVFQSKKTADDIMSNESNS